MGILGKRLKSLSSSGLGELYTALSGGEVPERDSQRGGECGMPH